MTQLGSSTKKRSRIARIPSASSLSSPFFNDPATSDFLLSLVPPSDAPDSAVQIHLHSRVIRRSKFFDALLSDRWLPPSHASSAAAGAGAGAFRLEHLTSHPIDAYFAVLRLLYTADAGDDLSAAIGSATAALDLLPVALELLFEDLIRSCVRFLEAVPWTEEEEARVISLAPHLAADESRDLLARFSPSGNTCEEMLHGLILTAIHNHSNMAFAKAFVAKILRELSDREAARRVLERAFETSLKIVKESLEEYSSPDFRGDHNETEAIQRLNLHTAMTNGRHLLWLVERMIELRVADTAVKEWSEQPALTADLQRAFRDDAWRNIVPGFPAVVLRCTLKLANAVASGTILAPIQVRTRLVKDWLPVLIVCKDNVSPTPTILSSHKSLYTELEDTFLRIISTLPLSDAQGLLQQCLSFSTRSVDDCPHLVTAFNTWFRRAARPVLPENNS